MRCSRAPPRARVDSRARRTGARTASGGLAEREAHDGRRRATLTHEFARLSNCFRHRIARRLHEAEAREVALGRRREQVQCPYVPRFRLRDDALDELATEPTVAPIRRDRGRPKQRVLAAELEPDYSPDAPIALRDDEVAKRIRDAGHREAARNEELLDPAEVR